jgi:4'-phosphopantetheinyl transferase
VTSISELRWRADPLDRLLDPGDIDLWLVRIDEAEAFAATLSLALSPGERERVSRVRAPHHRQRRALRWACRRAIVAGYVGCTPAALHFRHESAGRCLIEQHADLTFSAAHAGDISLVALGRGRPLGIDLEPLSAAARIEEVADSYLPRDRVRRVRATESQGREEEWVRLWTELEACAKLDGEGLGDLDAARAETLLGQAVHRVQFRPEPGYLATLVYEGRAARLSCFVFDPDARARRTPPTASYVIKTFS